MERSNSRRRNMCSISSWPDFADGISLDLTSAIDAQWSTFRLIPAKSLALFFEASSASTYTRWPPLVLCLYATIHRIYATAMPYIYLLCIQAQLLEPHAVPALEYSTSACAVRLHTVSFIQHLWNFQAHWAFWTTAVSIWNRHCFASFLIQFFLETDPRFRFWITEHMCKSLRNLSRQSRTPSTYLTCLIIHLISKIHKISGFYPVMQENLNIPKKKFLR